MFKIILLLLGLLFIAGFVLKGVEQMLAKLKGEENDSAAKEIAALRKQVEGLIKESQASKS